MKKRLHLIIVSYPSRLDATLEEIAHTIARGANEERVVERAQDHANVLHFIRLWHLRDRDVQEVDLIGHGAGGRFKLGDEVMFASDGTGLELIEQWKPYLSERATLRLLGCSVAAADSRTFDGQMLLKQIDARLGGSRRVLAPNRTLFNVDYGASGLEPRAERCLEGSTTPRRP